MATSATRRSALYRCELQMASAQLGTNAQGKMFGTASTVFGAYGTLPDGRAALGKVIEFRRTAYKKLAKLGPGRSIKFHARVVSHWVLQYFSFLSDTGNL